MKKDSLGDRMKGYYEGRNRYYLTRRTPVILRLDGKAFHSFTKGLKKPYDEIFHKTMNSTMKYLCENIQGCKLGYTQSDEITLLLTDYDTLQTDAWFDYNIQKMCSIAASMASTMFNKYLHHEICAYIDTTVGTPLDEYKVTYKEYVENLEKIDKKIALFDCRCFNIPKEEVANCFIWRQQDATRNAIQMLGQCNFSHKELHGKSCNEIQDMLMTEKGINFNDMPIEFKRGVACFKTSGEDIHINMQTKEEVRVVRTYWVIDNEIPIFTQDREYIEGYI